MCSFSLGYNNIHSLSLADRNRHWNSADFVGSNFLGHHLLTDYLPTEYKCLSDIRCWLRSGSGQAICHWLQSAYKYSQKDPADRPESGRHFSMVCSMACFSKPSASFTQFCKLSMLSLASRHKKWTPFCFFIPMSNLRRLKIWHSHYVMLLVTETTW